MRKALLSLALALYVGCLFVAGGPPTPLRAALAQHFGKQLSYLGLFNPYRFFAPDPLTEDIHLQAKVFYADGSSENYDFPHFVAGATSDLEHQRSMVFYYWQYLMVIANENNVLWPDACRFVARQHNRLNNPPRSIHLILNTEEVTLPAAGSSSAPQQKPLQVTLIRYNVKAEDLI